MRRISRSWRGVGIPDVFPDPSWTECPLCAGKSQIYDLTSTCCCVRLILAQPSRSRRAAILAAIGRRDHYASVKAVKAAVEAVYASRSPNHPRP
jgi:hypothetical protein